MTNYEKIKAMSVEEMAKAIGFTRAVCITLTMEQCDMHDKCEDCTKEWLLQEAEE